MQDRSHKLVFLGLTALMSAVAFYGSETGPTLLITKPTLLITKDVFPPASLNLIDPSETPLAAKLATDGACLGTASDVSQPCLGTSKVSLSRP